MHSTTTTKTPSKTPPTASFIGGKFHPYSLISPRIWHGMLFSHWMKLLARNRFAISPTRVPMAVAITMFSAGNSVMRIVQDGLYGRRAEAMGLCEDPIFVIGHWRSGTTLLHEMLAQDDRHSCPTTIQCFAPNHFLLTQNLFTRYLRFLLPQHRPMDNMAAGWDRAQEEEFALCNLGVPSPYLFIAFPNRARPFREYFDLDAISPEDRERWKETLLGFLNRVTLTTSKRLVLKSPLSTARIATLLELFPNARFVHIVRDPYVVFPSTVRMWRSLCEYSGLQSPRDDQLDDLVEFVLENFERMYERFEVDRDRIDPANFHQVRYEDLVRDPVAEMRQLYDGLELARFESIEPKLQKYLDDVGPYQTNRYELNDAMRAKVRARCGGYFERYGYGE